MTRARRFATGVNPDNGEVVLECFAPGRDADALSVGLRILTHQLMLRTPEDQHGGGCFGGTFGYGVNFENAVFLMHRYCWCEREDCLWCTGCGCDTGDCRFFIDGKEVTGEESFRRNKEFLGPMPHEKFPSVTHAEKPAFKAYRKAARVQERNRRWRTLYPAIQHSCARRQMFVDRPEGETHEPDVASRAPHFWHKPSGLRVRWYKYIGRDNEVHAYSDVSLAAVLEECLHSIGAPSLAEAVAAYEVAEAESAAQARRAAEFWTSEEGRRLMDKIFEEGVIKTFEFKFEGDDEASGATNEHGPDTRKL